MIPGWKIFDQIPSLNSEIKLELYTNYLPTYFKKRTIVQGVLVYR